VAADPLALYQSKRDFTKTAEPSGRTKVAKADRPRFVIQKHAATRLHYDLRLEHEGVFLSWAVTKGPSLDPEDKRLAVEVEPHPLDYGDFEGTIPKGEYGGGTVMLWDRGYWEPEPGLSIDAMLKKGHLTFRFDGERLKGGYHLVLLRNDRERGRGPKRNWLLIKRDDEEAHPGDDDRLLEESAFSVASGRTMEDIAAGKGKAPNPFITKVKRGAGAVWRSNRGSPEDSAAQVAVEQKAPKASPKERPKPAKGKPVKSLPDFVEPQLTKLVERPPVGGEWAHEIKFDGYRMQLRVSGGKATLRSRKGLDWTDKFKEIARDALKLPDGVYDGEICALDEDDKPSFHGLQAAISSGETGRLIDFLFDAMFLDGEDLRALPLRDRKARLQAVLEGAPKRFRYVDHFQTAGDAVLKSACRMDLEGIISKRLDAPYQSGRGDTWTKSKCRGGQEVVIAGWTTTGAAFRSLIAGVMRDGELIHVGRIGTGFGREKVAALLPRLQALETDQSPFKHKGAPRKAANVHWVKPELVAEIEYAGFTGDGHIRQASYKGLREDKPAREVVAEGAAAQAAVEKDAGAVLAKASKASVKAKAGSPVVLGVTLSNPDKPLWPAKGDQAAVTKLEHARYLESVAEWLMPYIQGRPCSLIRTPDGIEGDQRFFQRHAGVGSSALITEVPVRGDKKPYIQLDRIEAVIAAAQSGATEFHPWNCLPGQPELPGRFVFDLDPDEAIPFERVIEAAREVRDRLEDVGLNGFLKTTGGKGLHIVVPLLNGGKTPVDWPTAKAFTKRFVEQMAADSPENYTVNMAKKVRGGRIFLDYLRNDRLSTAVALMSARARPGATVSFPLSWSQARKGLDPKAYTVRTVPALMKKNRSWDGYEDAARPLKEAIQRL
jgi:bifunctional non-homologous end joining protein LigD